MKNLIKCLSISMAMMMLLLAACATDNSSNSGSDNAKTGVIGKWRESSGGGIIEFRADRNVYDESGSKIAEWTGNDLEGTVGFLQENGKTWSLYNFTISGNNMTWSSQENANQRAYYTRV